MCGNKSLREAQKHTCERCIHVTDGRCIHVMCAVKAHTCHVCGQGAWLFWMLLGSPCAVCYVTTRLSPNVTRYGRKATCMRQEMHADGGWSGPLAMCVKWYAIARYLQTSSPHTCWTTQWYAIPRYLQTDAPHTCWTTQWYAIARYLQTDAPHLTHVT